jgi:dTDP-4-amino-4,6-dideoxygalactose transaminase
MKLSTRESVEAEISERFDRDQCVLVGRATTGLTLIFDLLDIEGDVFYPAYMCPSPVYSAEYTNLTPRFCDVRSDYTIDIDDLRRSVTPNTDAIVPVHMFGHPVSMEEVHEVAEEVGAFVIEDACQSVAATLNGNRVGSFGDISLLSFGSGKPIDVGSGGAVLTDDADIASAVRTKASDVPVRDRDRLKQLFDHYRELYYDIEALEEVHPQASKLYRPFPEVFRELYHQGIEADVPEKIKSKLDDVNELTTLRRRHAEQYRSQLDHDAINHPSPRGDPVYYRYSIRLTTRDLRDYVVGYLRERDIHVSTLYKPIHKRFGSDRSLQTAEDLSEKTINLWVDETVDMEYVQRCCETILSAIDEFEGDSKL